MELRRKKVKEEEMGEGGRMTQKSYKLVGHFGHRYWSVPSLLEWRRERVARADLHLSVCLPYSLLFSFSPFLLPISCFPSFFPFPFLSFSLSFLLGVTVAVFLTCFSDAFPDLLKHLPTLWLSYIVREGSYTFFWGSCVSLRTVEMISGFFETLTDSLACLSVEANMLPFSL